MDLEATRPQRNRARDRRARLAGAALVVVIAVFFIVMAQYPRHGVPWSVRGPAQVLLTAVIVATTMFTQRADDWQRRKALLAFAIGSVAGILYLLGESLWAAADATHTTRPGVALVVIATTWLLGDVGLRQWPSMRSEGDDA